MATLNVSDLNRQGKVFNAANVSAKTMSTVSTTATGLIIYNPMGSGVKVVLIDCGFAWTTVPAAIHKLGIGVMASSPTVPTSLTAAGAPAAAADGSGNTGRALAYDAATLPVAPVARRWFGGAAWITGGAGEAPYMMTERIDGSIILVPGAAAQIISETTAAVGVAHFTWAEVAV